MYEDLYWIYKKTLKRPLKKMKVLLPRLQVAQLIEFKLTSTPVNQSRFENTNFLSLRRMMTKWPRKCTRALCHTKRLLRSSWHKREHLESWRSYLNNWVPWVLYQAASLESIEDPKCSYENFAPRLLHERVVVVS